MSNITMYIKPLITITIQQNNGNPVKSQHYYLIFVLSILSKRLNNNIGMQEMGGNHVWHKRSIFFLENYGYNIIPNVSLSL